MEMYIIVAAVILILFLKGLYDKKKAKRKLTEYIRKHFGQRPEKNYSAAREESIPSYCRNMTKSEIAVDDITWNDLDMNSVYRLINSCKCSIGDEYLYYLLRNPRTDAEALDRFEKLVSYLEENPEKREKLEYILLSVGGVKNISVYEYINRLSSASKDSNLLHIAQALIMVATMVMIPIIPAYGVLLFVLMFFINVVTYFKRKADIEMYFQLIAFLMRLLDNVKEFKKLDEGEAGIYTARICEASKVFRKMRFGSGIITTSGPSGDLLQSLLDYFRMALHIDLIKFNSVLKEFSGHTEEFNLIFENVGMLDCAAAVVSFRKFRNNCCIPELRRSPVNNYASEGKASPLSISISECFHPLLDSPIGNSFDFKECTLITGSNASGKSTFLKSIAINAILAQTIHTACAASYSSDIFHVMSSMDMSDNLAGAESYYIVEIKSLKRIIDAVQEKYPVLCFIDEVLRGTNTVERIAASSIILKDFSVNNCLAVVATHDIELTYILDKFYRNCHFEEHIIDNEIVFDYKLHDGRATTRNAIGLLKMIGYSEEIVNRATEMANTYLETNEWRLLEANV